MKRKKNNQEEDTPSNNVSYRLWFGMATLSIVADSIQLRQAKQKHL